MENWDHPNMIVCEGVVSQRVSSNDAFYKSLFVLVFYCRVYMAYILSRQLLLSHVGLLLLLNNEDHTLKSSVKWHHTESD